MNHDDLTHLDKFAEHRNPLSSAVGYHFGDNFGCVPCRFKWFDSIDELMDHILNVELPCCEYDQYEHDDYRARIEAVLKDVAAKGLTEEARDALNGVEWGFTVYWWGTLAELISGQTDFSKQILGSFAVARGRGCGVAPADMPAFLAFLRVSCQSDADRQQCSSGRDDPIDFVLEPPQEAGPRH